MRAALGTNNVDHCTRLCHASSVAALLEGIGSGSVTDVFPDAQHADLILLTGSNPTVNHPVAATFFKQAIQRGTKLVVVDPRRPVMADFADWYCQLRPGTDVAFYNAVLHVLVAEDLVDHDLRPRPHRELRRAARTGSDVPAGAGRPGLRHPGRHHPRGRPRDRHVPEHDGLLGHGHQPAHPRHRQRPLPDRAVPGDRQRRPARHRAAPAARPEQRAGRLRLRADPDGLPGLPAGRGRGGPQEVRSGLGRRRSTRSRASPSSRSWPRH